MPLDPYLQQRLYLVSQMSYADLVDPENMRKFVEFGEDPAPWITPAVEVTEHTIEGPHGSIPLRIYAPAERPAAALLWVHGGGFHAGDLDMPEAHVVSSELAARSNTLVVSVDYRLAVDGVRYPIPADDVQAAWRWLTSEYASEIPAVLGGASAGGALAVTVALRQRDLKEQEPVLLLLAYPFLHFPVPALDDETAATVRCLPPFMRFTTESFELMVGNYTGRISAVETYAMPGMADPTGLPRTALVLSEIDEIRSSGELFMKQLAESGVAASMYLAHGMPHGHLNRTPALPEVDTSLDYFARQLNGLRVGCR